MTHLNPIAHTTSGGGLGRIPDETVLCKCIWLLNPHMLILLLPKYLNDKCVRAFYRLYGMLQSDMTALMQHASPRMSNWVSFQQADVQTAANETESKSQTLNTQSSSLKVVRLTYLTSADAMLFPVAVTDIEISWWWIKCSAYLLLSLTWTPLNLHITRGIEDWIYIRFATIHLCGQV